MLLRDLPDLLANPERFGPILALSLAALLMTVTIHEFSHAAVALALGDDTARRQGRVTLNPIAHLDPMGTLMMLFVGFGWGKPVPFTPWRFHRNPRLSSSLVALAGPGSNLVTAIALGLLLRAVIQMDVPLPEAVERGLLMMLLFSLGLGFFNLVPLFPLDGFNVVRGLLPEGAGDQFAALAPWGPGILFGLVGIGMFTSFNPLSLVLSPLINNSARWLLGGGGFF